VRWFAIVLNLCATTDNFHTRLCTTIYDGFLPRVGTKLGTGNWPSEVLARYISGNPTIRPSGICGEKCKCAYISGSDGQTQRVTDGIVTHDVPGSYLI
jgi:hypothetical protein